MVRTLKEERWPWALLLLTFLAFFLRLHHLGTQSLWMDEGSTVDLATTSLERLLGRIPRSIAHPPLYYYLLHFWIVLAGKSEFALRYSSLLCGTLLVASLYRAGSRWMGKKTALLAALLAALAPAQVYYSQETRMYALASLLALWGFYLFTRLLREAPKATWLAYILVTAVSLYTHYYSFLVVAAENVVFLILIARSKERRGLIPSWALSQFALALLFLPWAWAPWGRVAGGYLEVRAQVFGASPSNVLDFLRQVMVGLTLGPTAKSGAPWSWLMVMALSLLFAFGAIRRRDLFALTYFLVPTTLAFLADQRFPHFVSRYLLLVAPAYYLILAQALKIERPITRSIPSLLGSLFLLGAFAWGLFHNYYDPSYARDDYRSLYVHIEGNSHPGEAIILDAPWQGGTFKYYYRGDLPRYGLPSDYPAGQKTLVDLAAISQEHTGLWLVFYGEASADPQRVVERWLQKKGYLAEEGWFGGVRLAHYLLPLPPDFQVVPLPQLIDFSGHLRLLNYEIGPTSVPSGQAVHLTFYWEALEKMETDYHLSVRLVDGEGEAWAQEDFSPLEGAYPTSSWKRGGAIRDQHRFHIPPGLPPGSYDLQLALYSPQDLQTLTITSGGSPPGQTWARLATLEVAPLLAVPTLPAPFIEKALPKDAGGLSLLGYGLSGQRFLGGEEIGLNLLWRRRGACGEETLILQLIDPRGQVWQENKVEGVVSPYPCSSWREREVVQGWYSLLVPAQAPAGEYKIRLALQTTAGPLRFFGGWPPWGQEWLEVARVQIGERERLFAPPSPQFPQRARLGSVALLLGYDLEKPPVITPGASLTLTLYWQAPEPTERSYTVFTHLVDGQGRIWGQKDNPPQGGARPTTSWVEGEIIIDRYQIVIGEDTPPGEYLLECGMYDEAGRLPASTEEGQALGDRVILDTPIVVELR